MNTLHDLISILYVLSSLIIVAAAVYSFFTSQFKKTVLMALCIPPLGSLLGVHGFIEFSSTWSVSSLLLTVLGITICCLENVVTSAVRDGIDKYYAMKYEAAGMQVVDDPPKALDPTVSSHEYLQRAQKQSIYLIPFLLAAPVTLYSVKPEIEHPLLTLSLLAVICCFATFERSRDLLTRL